MPNATVLDNPLDAYRALPPTPHALRIHATIEKEVAARIHDPSRARDHLHDIIVLRDVQDFVTQQQAENAACASDDRPTFLRMTRLVCKLTRTQLATISGISTTTIRRYELGQTLYPPTNRPLQIAAPLGAACLYHRASPAPNPLACIPLDALLTFTEYADLSINGMTLPVPNVYTG